MGEYVDYTKLDGAELLKYLQQVMQYALRDRELLAAQLQYIVTRAVEAEYSPAPELTAEDPA